MFKKLAVAVMAVGLLLAVGCDKKEIDRQGRLPEHERMQVDTPEPEPEPADTPTFTDPRDKKIYRAVKIGKYTWMAQNLNYQTKDSWCYGDDNSNCAKYGRLYTWDAARTACPAGWRLPSHAEWTVLVDYAGGASMAGSRLKSQTGWTAHSGISNTDVYGFSALPGGFRCGDGGSDCDAGGFGNVGNDGFWWSATEYDATAARHLFMRHYYDYVSDYWDDKTNAYSVRCLRDK